MYSVLLLDTDHHTHQTLGPALREAGYRVIHAYNGKQALAQLDRVIPAVAVMELWLPDVNGFFLVRHLRQLAKCCIMLVSHNTDEDMRIRSFAEGADDVICKPVVSVPELLMRIRAVLRRRDPQELIFSRIRIDLFQERVWLEEQEIKFSRQRFRFLSTLALHAGRVCTREHLMDAVAGEGARHDFGLVNVLAYAVRHRIEPDPNHPQFIHSIRGVGYYFIDTGGT